MFCILFEECVRMCEDKRSDEVGAWFFMQDRAAIPKPGVEFLLLLF